ncbi:Uncharacterised protein [Vibrio cholerae]|nr:Uncharacterised protein [Vibrio cholerae]
MKSYAKEKIRSKRFIKVTLTHSVPLPMPTSPP